MPLKLLVAVAIALSVSSGAHAGDAPASTQPAGDSIDGTWLVSAAELGGKRWPEQLVKATKLILKDGRYTVTLGDSPPDNGTVTVDTAANPKGMTITGTDGPNKGRTFPAIYEHPDADTLRICYDLSGTKRPTEFKSLSGTHLFLVTYTREKQ